jgi:hypothetical protein
MTPYNAVLARLVTKCSDFYKTRKCFTYLQQLAICQHSEPKESNSHPLTLKYVVIYFNNILICKHVFQMVASHSSIILSVCMSAVVIFVDVRSGIVGSAAVWCCVGQLARRDK